MLTGRRRLLAGIQAIRASVGRIFLFRVFKVHRLPIARRFGLALFVAGIVACTTDIASAQSAPVTARELKERHARIVNMSQLERDRLQRNLATFQQLPPEKQNEYRELNEKLEEDRNSGGKLHGLMMTYSAWLETLTPGQREELRQETDSAKKLALVLRFKDEQYRRVETFPIEPRESEFGPPPRGMRQPLLSTPDLNDIMSLLLAELPDAEQEKLAVPRLPQEHLKVMRQSIRHASDSAEWPSIAVQEKILGKLPQQLRAFIRNNPGIQRERTAYCLFFSVLREHDETRPKWPGEPELILVWNELNADQRAKLETQGADEKYRTLERRYFEPFENQRRELLLGLIALMKEIEIPVPSPQRPPRDQFGPPPPRGPNGFGPGDRRPPDDRRPDERRRGDRGPNDRSPNDRGPGDRGPDERGPGGREPGGRGPGERGPGERGEFRPDRPPPPPPRDNERPGDRPRREPE
jgi:hypothetical protein